MSNKIKKLKDEYRKVKDANKQTGNKQMKNKFYDKMNEIFHEKHSIAPPVILDTSANTETANCGIIQKDDVNEVPETDLVDEAVEDILTRQQR